MKDKRFFFHHNLTSTAPVMIDELSVHATASIENGVVFKTWVSDIQYNSISVYRLLKIIAPHIIKECEASALDCAKNCDWKEVKPAWKVKKEERDSKIDRKMEAYHEELRISGDKVKAEKRYFEAQ